MQLPVQTIQYLTSSGLGLFFLSCVCERQGSASFSSLHFYCHFRWGDQHSKSAWLLSTLFFRDGQLSGQPPVCGRTDTEVTPWYRAVPQGQPQDIPVTAQGTGKQNSSSGSGSPECFPVECWVICSCSSKRYKSHWLCLQLLCILMTWVCL